MLKPTKFGKYLLLERIAVGGMAEVFSAKAVGVEGFERLLAIKKILPTMGEDAEFISMFVDEARIAVQLSHANIVQVLELGKHDENLYIAMEYISGRDLRQLGDRFRKRQQPVPVPQAALIVAEVCEALDYAHRKRDARGQPLSIVHRDVSPQNVLVSYDGEVKLIDFGIAKAESRLQRTQAGILKGKFSYMSPEQVRGQTLDGRSDIFAAGILLWELVCGQKLFGGDSDFAILEKVRNGIVPPPRSIARHCPEALEKVIFKALANDPGARYQTASELHDDLIRFTVQGDAMMGSRQLAEWMRVEFHAEYEKEQARLRTWLGSAADEDPETTPSDPVRRNAIILPNALLDRGPTPADAFPGPALLNAAADAASTTQQFRLPPDKDTLVQPPAASKVSSALEQELPTMKMEGDALVQAEKEFAARKAAQARPTPQMPVESVVVKQDDEPTRVDPVVAAPPEAPPPRPPARAPSPHRTPASTQPLERPADVPSGFDISDQATRAGRLARRSPMARPLGGETAKPVRKSNRRILIAAAALVVLGAGAVIWMAMPADEERPGRITVTLTPSTSAELVVDGQPAGPLPPFVHTLKPGRHHLEIRADGYKPFSADVRVPSGGRAVEIDAQLVAEGPMQVDGVVLTQPRPEAAQKPKPPEKVAEAPARKTKPHWWQGKHKQVAVAQPEPEPAAPVAAAPAPAEDVSGARLRIVTDPPGADVSVDGQSLGKSPVVTGKLEPGAYHSVVAHLDGYAPARRASKVEEGVTEVKLALTQADPDLAAASAVPSGMGYLTAATRPSSRLSIDGRDTGRWTPVPAANPIALSPGAHTLVFETADGRRVEEQLKIEAGKTARVNRSVP